MPAGTYEFTVRATNAAGHQRIVEQRHVDIPAERLLAPNMPVSFSVAATGRTVSAYWLAPATGTTPTRYAVEARLRNANSSTTALGTFPVTGDHHFEPGRARPLRGPCAVGKHLRQQRVHQLAGRHGAIGAAHAPLSQRSRSPPFPEDERPPRGLGLSSLGLEPARQFFVRDVQAQRRVTDYKALVCVYMFGGNDANNLIVPVDNYTAYSTARGGTAGVALPANTLLPIPGPGGATYGLHPSVPELAPSTTPATWRSC